MDLTSPAHLLRDRLRAREVSATELLEATLRRIETVNPAVNAVVGADADLARASAAESDRRLAAGEARPLEGLVVTVKDAFDVAGLRSTAGAPSYKDRIPTVDAAPVARLRNAGAVILAKSNVPTFVSDFQSYNPVYGTTNNPWDWTRSPGGSSGGAAVAVATGMSAFELASTGRLGALAGPCLRRLRPQDRPGGSCRAGATSRRRPSGAPRATST